MSPCVYLVALAGVQSVHRLKGDLVVGTLLEYEPK